VSNAALMFISFCSFDKKNFSYLFTKKFLVFTLNLNCSYIDIIYFLDQ